MPVLGAGAVAFFVFLAGAAGTGIVAADFGAAADYTLNRFTLTGAGHAGLLEFAALAALEGFLKIVD